MDDKYIICPNCGHERFWPKYINNMDITICSKCGHWIPLICEDLLGLLDLEDENSEKDTPVKVDQED